MNFKIKHLLVLIAGFLSLTSATATTGTTKPAANLPPVGTKEILDQFHGITIEATVQGPAAQETPLQIVCVFEYVEGDIYNPPALPKESNGMVHLDEALDGLIQDLRKTNKFEGKLLETLLIIPPENTIPAQKLLLIGLGSRNTFKPQMMQSVGLVGMREALRMGVASYSHASDLQDAGFSSPVSDVAGNVIKGAISAYQTQMYLYSLAASNPLTVKKITVLAGPAFYEEAKAGIRKVLSNLCQPK